MLLTIQLENGGRSEGVVLAADEDWLRVARAGDADTIEITRLGGQWWDERGRRIALGALIAVGG